MTSVPISPRLSTRPLAWLRSRFRASEGWFIALAIAVGTVAGLLAVLQSTIAHGLQVMLFGLNIDDRLSAARAISPWRLLWLPVGGLVLGVLGMVLSRLKTQPVVDVVEANALHGGRMSLRGSLVICIQTLISNGFGASVGLEAAYAQAGGGFAAALGSRLRLRRNDLRTLVGAGAGAAIGAAFGAPLTGAFYAFEVVIGSYAPSMIAPVAAAALAAVLAAQGLGSVPYSIKVAVFRSPDAIDFILYAGLGALCAALGVALMQLVARGDALVHRLPIPAWLRTAVGGCVLALLAIISPQTLSSGHGALFFDLSGSVPLKLLLFIFTLKAAASVVSLASGFRGGLFFASLLLGSLVGQIYARLAGLAAIPIVLQPENAALVGMGAFATAVVGGPLTMSFLVLETTRDFGVAAATLAASLIASSIVRERFGYSFSTWRLHLRGETIRSARDVGWVRALTAGRMMRTDVPTMSVNATVAEFRRRFPLGSVTRVILIDDAQRYAGIVVTASAYGHGVDDDEGVRTLAVNKDVILTPEMNIEQVMQTFDRTETEDLPVVDEKGQVLGLLAEVYVVRRYAKELETVQQGLFGEA
ncbi:chloride channel protein [Phenylobacterium sp.]|jgi:CIC family chloride channel protein|uniref:chloride channel protein n=1 Tax=Phenylobacterium sp. TaxID=1871053 RepID=UPI002E3695B6|nr:chloride channel protein [Phenylobacterium sp.]HEX4709831.1 chloride channel protein [Phenylobacterium sp.]